MTLVNSLDIFDEREAEAFLDAYGIVDLERRKEILEFSGRLPVLMSWLSTPDGQDTDSAVPTHDIVERFLRWIPRPKQQTALLAAIPRSFNIDILKLLMDNSEQHDDVSSIFDWLLTMSFVQQRLDGWQYHPVVRRLMLRYQRQRSPDTYQRLHTKLAEFYNTKRHEISSSINEEWTNEEWRSYTLAYTYHYLVADSVQHLSEIISLFVVALRNRRSFAIEILEFLNSEDFRDELSREQNNIVELFRQQMEAIDAGTLRDGLQMFDKLCTIPGLSSEAKYYVLIYRGLGFLLQGKSEQALSDFEDAMRVMPEDVWGIASRGTCYFLIGRYAEALTDFDYVISVDKEDSSAFAVRGIIHGLMGHLQEALTDLDHAISLDKDEGDFWKLVLRGIVHSFSGHYPEALTDLDRSIALGEMDAWGSSSQTLNYLINYYPELLADFGRAVVSGQDNIWFSNRRLINYDMGQFPDILENFVKLMALNETKNFWVVASRGFIYMLMKRYEEAIADFSQAIILDEKNAWFITSRGLAYMSMKRYKEAIADFSQAIILDEKNAWFIATRGDIYRRMGHYKEALADFGRAIALDDGVAWVFDHRGEVYRVMGRYEAALSDIDHAIVLGYDSYNSRGLVLSYLERYEEAIDSYEQELKKNPNDYQLLYNIAISMVRWKGLSYAQKYMDVARTALQSEVIAGVRGAGLYGLGGLEAVIGNFDTALDYLEQAIADREEAIDWARQDMAWEDLRIRNDPRLRSLVPVTE